MKCVTIRVKMQQIELGDRLIGSLNVISSFVLSVSILSFSIIVFLFVIENQQNW